jgi:hypothetical protein
VRSQPAARMRTPSAQHAAVEKASDARCETYFARYVGIDYDSSAYDYYYATPYPSGWRRGDHKAICLADDPDHPEDNTISLRNVRGVTRLPGCTPCAAHASCENSEHRARASAASARTS